MDQPELGKKILELRLSQGLTQGELAEKCKVSLRTVQRLESAEVTPRSQTIKLVFSSLGYNQDEQEIVSSSSSKTNDSASETWLEQFFRYVLELFNLKTNTMKKISILSVAAGLITAALVLTNTDLKAQEIKGWFLAGSHPKSYVIGLDKTVFKSDGSSAFLESKEDNIEGFGTLMQRASAEDYRGKRVKMTAYVKSKDVVKWSGMWLRIDSAERGKSLGFDNMQDRPIKGTTDWTKYEIILDVPEESVSLNYGILVAGTGKVWFDDVQFEVVDKLTTEETQKELPLQSPTNLNFAE
ncbi:helix-turn-helix protein [Mangrovibacterium diazotrophicum]|uniref:Helix-turn-helix protein n=2 Tax=Mangrovibacterium diazotrophicum TaxID=1261403 RepID=A0A419WAE7_9BACT|nr:helix-turn-helix protein [Mangrovibacterium diazotrophicum]